jgi:hypothetical protein
MESPSERVERIEAMRGLIDRLCSPELTLGEAKSLRTQLLNLLGRNDLFAETEPSALPLPFHRFG